MDKQNIRKIILQKRNELSLIEVKKRSNKIFRRLIATEEFRNAKTIMLYVSKDNEVATRTTIKYIIKHKKIICVPKTDKRNRKLYPIKIKDPDKDLQIGHFGIYEPLLDIKKIIHKNKIDLIVTPGIAFDKLGYRLGWGKGYYDRFLENTKGIPKIGLAYSFQIVPILPIDKHDIPMDMVITEKKNYQKSQILET